MASAITTSSPRSSRGNDPRGRSTAMTNSTSGQNTRTPGHFPCNAGGPCAGSGVSRPGGLRVRGPRSPPATPAATPLHSYRQPGNTTWGAGLQEQNSRWLGGWNFKPVIGAAAAVAAVSTRRTLTTPTSRAEAARDWIASTAIPCLGGPMPRRLSVPWTPVGEPTRAPSSFGHCDHLPRVYSPACTRW